MTSSAAMDDRQLARLYSLGRAAIGVALVLFPRLSARGIAGDGASAASTKWLTRALGGRDAIIGLGSYAALQDGQRMRPWLHYGATADAIDAAATLLAYRQLPKRRRFLLLLFALSGAATGIALAQRES